MDKEKEAELRQKYGSIVIAKVGGIECVFRPPTDTDYEAMQDGILKAQGDKQKIGPVFRQYCLASLIEPSLDDFAALLVRYPAVAPRIADALSDLAGAEVEIVTKKG